MSYRARFESKFKRWTQNRCVYCFIVPACCRLDLYGSGYMLLDLIGAFDRRIIQPIRKDPYIIEANNTRIIRPVIDTSFLRKKSLIIDMPSLVSR